jgi:TRAP-type mannitol/chloroaromatic compound transport system permease small subunit
MTPFHKSVSIQWICRTIDGLIRALGAGAAWFNVVLMLVIIVQVILRYAFGKGLVLLEELQWHLYAVAFMVGLSYVLTEDANIRLDILHSRFSRRTCEMIEIGGIVLLLMPFITIFFLHGLDFVANSWRVAERSDAPMGLPYRWAIKAVIPISFGLLFLAAVSRLIKAVAYLTGESEDKVDGHQ